MQAKKAEFRGCTAFLNSRVLLLTAIKTLSHTETHKHKDTRTNIYAHTRASASGASARARAHTHTHTQHSHTKQQQQQQKTYACAQVHKNTHKYKHTQPYPPTHSLAHTSSHTTVAHKRPRSFCQKCRWQVAPKHAYNLDPTKLEWADFAVQAYCRNQSRKRARTQLVKERFSTVVSAR